MTFLALFMTLAIAAVEESLRAARDVARKRALSRMRLHMA